RSAIVETRVPCAPQPTNREPHMKTSICLATAVALALAASPALAQTSAKGTWTAVGKPRCWATYSLQSDATATTEAVVYPVGAPLKITPMSPTPGPQRPATAEETRRSALVISGNELAQLMAGGTLQYQVQAFAGTKTVEVSGAGLAAALKQVKAMCDPSATQAATDATVAKKPAQSTTQSTQSTQQTQTNQNIAGVVQATQNAQAKTNPDTS